MRYAEILIDEGFDEDVDDFVEELIEEIRNNLKPTHKGNSDDE